jgi:hypothetical protein
LKAADPLNTGRPAAYDVHGSDWSGNETTVHAFHRNENQRYAAFSFRANLGRLHAPSELEARKSMAAEPLTAGRPAANNFYGSDWSVHENEARAFRRNQYQQSGDSPRANPVPPHAPSELHSEQSASRLYLHQTAPCHNSRSQHIQSSNPFEPAVKVIVPTSNVANDAALAGKADAHADNHANFIYSIDNNTEYTVKEVDHDAKANVDETSDSKEEKKDYDSDDDL